MKERLKLIPIALFLIVSSGAAYAHNGEDPNRELRKSTEHLNAYQSDFDPGDGSREMKNNLEDQLNSIRSRLLLLRNELASDSSMRRCINKDSEIDYFKELDRTLKSSDRFLKQVNKLLDSVK
ncbi:hypothetical protein [Marinagarivorans cellulosilyticus]|uniref:Uncharacterized protein n=1 Tax=Marinagarivorans cellulosilyticus TaxID=2721545 RepID=A0AAN1WJF3_9GAMM|nr:hypothetical protein [Marinagarivorans cellulosilyticus]BCD98692.1 hypothetical protein MARGE09_P2893 [Marinagarivorans cellulosilyticus]